MRSNHPNESELDETAKGLSILLGTMISSPTLNLEACKDIMKQDPRIMAVPLQNSSLQESKITPLMQAIAMEKSYKTGKHQELALYLIDQGVPLDVTDQNHVSIFTKASYAGLLPVIEALIEKGVSVDNRTLKQALSLSPPIPALISYLEGLPQAQEERKKNAAYAAIAAGTTEAIPLPKQKLVFTTQRKPLRPH